jgi:hypothetical protein
MFIERIGLVSAREIARTAKDRCAGSLGFAETIMLFYNKKTKAGLDLAKLYEQARRERGQGSIVAQRPSITGEQILVDDISI